MGRPAAGPAGHPAQPRAHPAHLEWAKTDWFGAQLSAGASLGTLRKGANVGGALLVGELSGYDEPLLIGNEGDFVIQDFSRRKQYGHPHAYLAVAATAVASNGFIDARTPFGPSRIERRGSHGMWQWGFALPLSVFWPKETSRLVYAQTARSRDFSSPGLPGAQPTQRWASFAFVRDFEQGLCGGRAPQLRSTPNIETGLEMNGSPRSRSAS